MKSKTDGAWYHEHEKKSRKPVFLAVWLAVIAVMVIGIILLWPPGVKHETIKEVMRDGVLHEHNKMSLFGLEANPGLISAYMVTSILLTAAALIRLFAIPKFQTIPHKFQSIIEKPVEFFSDMAKNQQPSQTPLCGHLHIQRRCLHLFGTLFELFGIQWITTTGMSISLPAPTSVSASAEELTPAKNDEAVISVKDTATNENDVLSTKAIAAAIVVGVVGWHGDLQKREKHGPSAGNGIHDQFYHDAG